MRCFHCHKEYKLTLGKLGFRETCSQCGRDLHVCKNCRHYIPGKPNDCNVPGTEPIKDREIMNFCEDFSPLKDSSKPNDSSYQKAKDLFGEEVDKKPKSGKDRFDSLFDE